MLERDLLTGEGPRPEASEQVRGHLVVDGLQADLGDLTCRDPGPGPVLGPLTEAGEELDGYVGRKVSEVVQATTEEQEGVDRLGDDAPHQGVEHVE